MKGYWLPQGKLKVEGAETTPTDGGVITLPAGTEPNAAVLETNVSPLFDFTVMNQSDAEAGFDPSLLEIVNTNVTEHRLGAGIVVVVVVVGGILPRRKLVNPDNFPLIPPAPSGRGNKLPPDCSRPWPAASWEKGLFESMHPTSPMVQLFGNPSALLIT